MTGDVAAALPDGGDPVEPAGGDCYFELEPEPVVPAPDGDEAAPLPEVDGVDAEPREESVDDGLLLPVVRPDVDGDADGVVVPRSLVLPDGLWLHPVMSVATSAAAKTPPSNFFMETPPDEIGQGVGQQAKCRREPLAPRERRGDRAARLDTAGVVFYY